MTSASAIASSICRAIPRRSAFHFSLGAPIAAGATSTGRTAVYYALSDRRRAARERHATCSRSTRTSPRRIASVWMQQRRADALATASSCCAPATPTRSRRTAANDNIPIVISSMRAPRADPRIRRATRPRSPRARSITGSATSTRATSSASDPWVVWIARGKNRHRRRAEVAGRLRGRLRADARHAGHRRALLRGSVRNPGETRFYRDSAAPTVITVTNTTDYSLMVRNYMATSDVDVDWLRARARVNPDPTITVGAEELL